MDLKTYGIDFHIDDILRKDIEAFIKAKKTASSFSMAKLQRLMEISERV